MNNIFRKFFLFTLLTATAIAFFIFFILYKWEFIRSREWLSIFVQKNTQLQTQELNAQKDIELPAAIISQPPSSETVPSLAPLHEESLTSPEKTSQSPEFEEWILPSSAIAMPKKILIEVPFTVQAPYANWNDPRQKHGCEEAVSLMALRWAEGKKLTSKEALREIIAISDFEKKKYGEFQDASSEDTLEWIIKDYFGYKNAFLRYDITVEDIKKELAEGNVVIVPVDGRTLKNPFYTQSGPERHKILIKGYDDTTQEFITNDPGTRRGEGYRYGYSVLERALADYLTGKEELVSQIRSAMIVVSK